MLSVITGPWVEGTEVALTMGTRWPMWMRACSRLLTRITGLARVFTSLSWALIFSCGDGEMLMRSAPIPLSWSRMVTGEPSSLTTPKVLGHCRPRSRMRWRATSITSTSSTTSGLDWSWARNSFSAMRTASGVSRMVRVLRRSSMNTSRVLSRVLTRFIAVAASVLIR
ncbi:hypothetical protein D3C84_320200 [compost metagenome]